MVEQNSPDLDAIFHALSDATRRAMLRRLAGGEVTVGDLATPHPMSLAAASKHIRVLEEAGLVRRTVRGAQPFLPSGSGADACRAGVDPELRALLDRTTGCPRGDPE